jgi:hypothetical protein
MKTIIVLYAIGVVKSTCWVKLQVRSNYVAYSLHNSVKHLAKLEHLC